MRAETLELLDEDVEELEARKDAWRAALSPQDDYEQQTIDEAVEYSWLQERARRAQAARLAADRANAGLAEAKREADEVLRLGARLFADNRGPLADYPHIKLSNDCNRNRVSVSELTEDPQDPPRLVLHLQSTAGGCLWLLDRWAELKQILDDGLLWQSADKLRAVRLLGRQALEAVDDRNVLMIFLACQTLEGRPPGAIREILNELLDEEVPRYSRRLQGRGVDQLAPKTAADAHQVLYDTIDREMTRIEAMEDDHRRRNETLAALAADRLLFDDTPEGELLRRYELANGRGKARAIHELRAHRRFRCESSVVSGQLSEDPLPETTATGEIVANEPNDGPLPIKAGPLAEPASRCETVTSEATDTSENFTNEPTDESPVFDVSHFLVSDCVPNEPEEALTNEATDGPASSDHGPSPEDGLPDQNAAPVPLAVAGVPSPEKAPSVELAGNESCAQRPLLVDRSVWPEEADDQHDAALNRLQPQAPEEKVAEDAGFGAELEKKNRKREQGVARNRDELAKALAHIREEGGKLFRQLNEDARGEGKSAQFARRVLHEVSIKANKPAGARRKRRGASAGGGTDLQAMVQTLKARADNSERLVHASVESGGRDG